MQETELAKQINRMIQLCKFVNKGDDEVTVRTAEYSRILRAGLRDDAEVSAVVDDLVEHCEEIPTPAEMHAAIRRYNEARLDKRYNRRQETERQEWPKLYGSPTAILGDNCIECGASWKEILRKNREGMAEEARRAKEIMRTGGKDWDLAYSQARAELKRDTRSSRRHSETCAGRLAPR